MRERVINAIRDFDDCGSELAAAYADAAIANILAELENPSVEMVKAALKHGDIDGEVYHIEDFQLFIQGIAAHLRKAS